MINRQFEVLLNDETFIAPVNGRQFRVVFDILIDFGGATTYADIAIYNLSIDTANKAFKKGTILGLRAGYEETIDFIFRGAIQNVFKERSGPDTITRIIARGGSQPKTATVNQTLGKDARLVDIIRACVSAMGYPIVIRDEDFADVPPFPRGQVLTGDPRVYLDNLSVSHKFKYMIENERVIVVADNSYRRGTPYLVSQFSGMEGIPEITENGCDVSVRLSPKLRIGGQIDVQTDLATFNFSNIYFQDVPGNAGKGIYRIFRLRHTGDSWGDTWTSSITSIR
jgi:hypothetical protein